MCGFIAVDRVGASMSVNWKCFFGHSYHMRLKINGNSVVYKVKCYRCGKTPPIMVTIDSDPFLQPSDFENKEIKK